MTKEEYVKRVAKKLKCSGSKREEIKKQLDSDIASELENGEGMENIISRMGTPESLAQEFNENFPEEERKAAKKKKNGTVVGIVAVIIIVLAALVYWCLPKSDTIESSGRFNEAKIEEQAKKVISMLDKEDYEGLIAYSNATMQASLQDEVESWQAAKDQINSDWGEFVSYGNSYMADVKQMGKEFALVQMNVSYENVSVTYTITFDVDGKLAGLYMK